MPDPERKSISASEAAALFNASPYITRWMLWHRFANGVDISGGDDSRKMWGRLFQHTVIQQVAREKKLEVIANADDTYVRKGFFGCTRDATIICPDRGPGALEIKCVFDFRVWAESWRSGEYVPRQNEIQLQTQMAVGDGETPYNWGIIAVWVCGSPLYYFERKPIKELWLEMGAEAQLFFESVRDKIEPDAVGELCEAPLVARLYPQIAAAKEIDLSTDPDHVKTSEDVSMYQYHKELVSGNESLADKLRLKLLALAQDAERVKLPCGVYYRVAKSGKGKKIIPYVPEHPLPPPPPKGEIILAAG